MTDRFTDTRFGRLLRDLKPPMPSYVADDPAAAVLAAVTQDIADCPTVGSPTAKGLALDMLIAAEGDSSLGRMLWHYRVAMATGNPDGTEESAGAMREYFEALDAELDRHISGLWDDGWGRR